MAGRGGAPRRDRRSIALVSMGPVQAAAGAAPTPTSQSPLAARPAPPGTSPARHVRATDPCERRLAPPHGRRYFVQRSSHASTVSCHWMLLAGLSTQWFSSGK